MCNLYACCDSMDRAYQREAISVAPDTGYAGSPMQTCHNLTLQAHML